MRTDHEDSCEMKEKSSVDSYDLNAISSFMLECIRQGRVDLIQNYCSDEQKRELCRREFMGNRAYALRTCMILWVDALKTAQNAGIPYAVADAVFERCISRSQSASTPEMLIGISEKYLMELAQAVDNSWRKSHDSPIFTRFLKYIQEHILENLSIDKVADALNISKSHLSHTIKRETGETVHNWIMKEKINVARIMLSDKKYNMNQIWNVLGFCSQSHFAKCFRQVTGVTPSQFRTDLLK